MATPRRSRSRRATDSALRRMAAADELTRQAFEGVFVLQGGRVVYCNDSFARMAGRSVAEIRKWSRRQLQSVVHPEDRARIQQQYEGRLQGRPIPSEYDCRMIRPDGRVIWVRSYVGLIDYHGHPALRLACIDITAQKEAEDAYRTLVDHSIQGLIVVQAGRIVYANAAYCELSGYTADELCKSAGMRMEQTIAPEDRPRVRERYRLRLAGRPQPPRYDIRLLRKDGQVRRIEVFASDSLFRGQPAIQAAVVDVTDRRDLEEAVYRAGIEERQRIGQDIHDTLGQQLAGIGYLSHSLRERLQDRSATEAKDAATIANTVSETLRQVRQLSRGLIPFSIAEEGLCNALRRLARDASKMFSTPCRLSCAWRGAPVDEITATHLYHIAQEAVNNAMRHGKPSRVSVRLSAGRTHGRLTVADDGKGRPAKPGAKEGIGLRIMRHRAEMIGGQLAVEETARAATSVTCVFPLAAPRS